MCNNTEKKAAGAGKDFTLFFGVMLHLNFKCVLADRHLLTFILHSFPNVDGVRSHVLTRIKVRLQFFSRLIHLTPESLFPMPKL